MSRPPADGAGEHVSIYRIQNWFNLSDRQLEDALYEIESVRCFTEFYGITDRPAGREHDADLSLKGCWFPKARWWMPHSFMHQVRPRIENSRVILRCTKRRRESNGTLVWRYMLVQTWVQERDAHGWNYRSQWNGHQRRPTRATPGRRRGYFHHTSPLPRPSLIHFCMAVSESDRFLFDIKKAAGSRPVWQV